MSHLRFADGATWSLDPPRIMGILNVTPDSFSDGGRYVSLEAAVAQGVAMARAGADIVDVGGESTRPGADPVPVDEQIARVVPVIRALTAAVDVPISIDTTSAAVAEAALDAGADVVNDVTAGRGDPALLPLAGARSCPVVLMHMQGTPRSMQAGIRYDDVVEDVARFLAERAEAALAAGVSPDRVVVDPGIGFGKTVAHNLQLLRDLARIRAVGYPVLVGPSRKSFLGAVTGRAVDDREMATAAAVAAAILAGAAIVRVHDVAAMIDVVRVAMAIRTGSESKGTRERPAVFGPRRPLGPAPLRGSGGDVGERRETAGPRRRGR